MRAPTLRAWLAASLLLTAFAACASESPGQDDDAETVDGSTDDGESGLDTSDTGDTGDTGETGETDILDALLAIEGMSVEELESTEPGVRLFELHFLQPADHDDPEAGWFEQRIFLRHRDPSTPMVLFTTGYYLFYGPSYESEPATLLAANQLSVEQRFFGSSRPNPLDWSLLTIEQAASDHHRLVEALAPIYTGRWLSTGISKGGMTSIYHRRFYPEDVDATVAYVAPHSLALRDQRYPVYLDQIGDPECAQALRDLQIEALARRSTLELLLANRAADNDYTFERYGGLARAFEASIIELRWSFWQYSGAPHCPFVPDAEAADEDIDGFVEQHLGWSSFSDVNLELFEPYYYQAATELGAPDTAEAHLEGHLDFPIDSGWEPLLPAGTQSHFDPTAMPDISAWMDSEGERLMLVYGEWDPWSAGPFDPGGAPDTHVYWASMSDHGAELSTLPDAEFAEAVAILDGWMGVSREEIEDPRQRRATVLPWPIPQPPRR